MFQGKLVKLNVSMKVGTKWYGPGEKIGPGKFDEDELKGFLDDGRAELVDDGRKKSAAEDETEAIETSKAKKPKTKGRK